MQWIEEAVGKEDHRADIAALAAVAVLKNAFTADTEKLTAAYNALLPWLRPGDFRHMTISGSEIPAALETVSGWPQGPVRDHLISALASQSLHLAGGDPLAAAGWLHRISDPAAAKYLAGVVTSHPKTAGQADAVLQALPPALQTSMISNLTELQANRDGAAAVTWAQNLPNEEWQNVAVRVAIRTWAWNTALEASAWVETLPPGSARDEAAVALMTGIADREPTAAVTWGLSIGDPAKRSSALEYVFTRWKDKLPEAARVAVASSALPETIKQHLLSNVAPAP